MRLLGLPSLWTRIPGTSSTPLAMDSMIASWFFAGPDAPQILGEMMLAGKPGHSCAMLRLPGQLPSACRRVSVTMQVCWMMLPCTPCGPTPEGPGTMLLDRPPEGLQPALDAQVAAEATTIVAAATAMPASGRISGSGGARGHLGGRRGEAKAGRGSGRRQRRGKLQDVAAVGARRLGDKRIRRVFLNPGPQLAEGAGPISAGNRREGRRVTVGPEGGCGGAGRQGVLQDRAPGGGKQQAAVAGPDIHTSRQRAAAL